MKRWEWTLVTCVCIAVWFGADPPFTAGIEREGGVPATQRFSMEFRDAEVKDVLRLLGQESGLNILVGDEITGKISVSFKEVTLEQALASILQSFGYAYSMVDSIVLISKKPIPEKTITPMRGGEAAGGAPGRFSLEFKDAEIRDVLRLLGQKSGMNILVGDDITGKITSSFKDVTLEQALASILQSFGYSSSVTDGIVLISKKPFPDKYITRAVQIRYLVDVVGGGDPNKAGGDGGAKLRELAKSLEHMLSPSSKDQDRSRGVTVNAASSSGLGPAPDNSTSSAMEAARKEPVPEEEKNKGLYGEARIAVFPQINTLVITDLPERVGKIVALIKELDQPTPQVKIEARIVEVKDIYQKELGIKWGMTYNADSAHGSSTSYEFPNSVNVSGTEGDGSYMVNLPASSPVAGVGISLGHIANILSLDLKLSAMEKMDKVKILSTPSILTMQGKEAVIKVGEQVPFWTTSATSTTTSATTSTTTTTIDFKDIVLQLRVVPSILPEGRIILDLVVNKDTRGQDVIFLDQQTFAIDTKSLSTRVLLNDGETGVIGGLYTQQDRGSDSQVPLLGRIPLLGWLFRSRADDKTRNELLIFITPRIQRL